MNLTKEDYNNAMVIIERLMDQDPEPDTAEGAALKFLAEICERYECAKFA